MEPLLSLCIPTNGVSQWVLPVLDSIYSQNINTELYEVIVADNGNNISFKNAMEKYAVDKENLLYIENSVEGFLNEIESYKAAKGILLKFVNHRTCLVEGTIEKFLEFINENRENKPVVYFSNGVMKDKKLVKYDTFDEFVRGLSYWSSWSTGMTIWRDDFQKIKDYKLEDYNTLFPHTTILFGEREKKQYIIDNSVIFNEIPPGKTPKGNYDLFNAFSVEYPSIILELYRDGSIIKKTYKKVLKDNLAFVAILFFQFKVAHMYCSYDISGFSESCGFFYSKSRIIIKSISSPFKLLSRKFIGK